MKPAARTPREGRLWKNGVACPKCKAKERITTRKDGFYRCNPCKLDFTVRTGTIFERSPRSPSQVVLCHVFARYGPQGHVSACNWAKRSGLLRSPHGSFCNACAKPARTMVLCSKALLKLTKLISAAKKTNRHFQKRLNLGSGTAGKTVVMGMRERGGRAKAFPILGNGRISSGKGHH